MPSGAATMKTPLVALVFAVASIAAQAQQNCDKPRDDFDGLYCLNKVYVETDAELNQAYGELARQLPADARPKLKAGQLAWIEARNSQCSRRMDGGFFVNLNCATRTTRERLQFIQERARECKSSGCQPSRL
jgi:uncharacterized protein YecT (DUF1311 family)